MTLACEYLRVPQCVVLSVRELSAAEVLPRSNSADVLSVLAILDRLPLNADFWGRSQRVIRGPRALVSVTAVDKATPNAVFNRCGLQRE